MPPAPGGGELADGAFLTPPPPAGVGMRCSVLDQFSYGQVKVMANRLTVTPKDIDGNVISRQRPAVRRDAQLYSLTVKLPFAVAAALAALLIIAPGAAAERSVPQGFFGVMYDHGIEKASRRRAGRRSST